MALYWINTGPDLYIDLSLQLHFMRLLGIQKESRLLNMISNGFMKKVISGYRSDESSGEPWEQEHSDRPNEGTCGSVQTSYRARQTGSIYRSTHRAMIRWGVVSNVSNITHKCIYSYRSLNLFPHHYRHRRRHRRDQSLRHQFLLKSSFGLIPEERWMLPSTDSLPVKKYPYRMTRTSV